MQSTEQVSHFIHTGYTIRMHFPYIAPSEQLHVPWYLYSMVSIIEFICVQWLEKEFLGYLDEWKASVASRPGLKPAEQARMCLSRETLEGLHITGMPEF